MAAVQRYWLESSWSILTRVDDVELPMPSMAPTLLLPSEDWPSDPVEPDPVEPASVPDSAPDSVLLEPDESPDPLVEPVPEGA